MRQVLRLVIALALALGCEGTDPGEAGAPASLRGEIVIEPPRITIGDVAQVEITVVTPPNHQVRPIRPPREVPGFWLLDAEPLPTRRSAARWVHRTRIRARAREPGSFSWPAMQVEIEAPDQQLIALDLEERPLEVSSVEPEFPQRRIPFPLRPAPDPASQPGLLAPVAAGALLTLVVIALAALVRRERARRRATGRPLRTDAAIPPPAWRSAQATLEAAHEVAERDPERAAGDAAAALRHFFSHRFALPAQSLTTEELSALAPPIGADRHWSTLIEILSQLDALRFPPPHERSQEGDATDAGSTLRSILEQAQRLVAEAAPELRWR